MKLFTREGGTPGQPTVLFLHGASVTSWMWQDHLDALPDAHTLAPDLPGLGRNAHAGDFSIRAAAEDLAALVRQRAKGGAAHIVGHSLGGAVAAQLAAAHPDVVRSVVLIGVTTRPIPFERAFVSGTLAMTRLARRPRLLRLQARALSVPAAFRETFVQEQLDLGDDSLRRVLHEAVAFRVPPALLTLSTPALVLVGAREPSLNQRSALDLAAALPRVVACRVPRGHHAWMAQRPELLNAVLRAWLREEPLPAELEELTAPQGVRAAATSR